MSVMLITYECKIREAWKNLNGIRDLVIQETPLYHDIWGIIADYCIDEISEKRTWTPDNYYGRHEIIIETKVFGLYKEIIQNTITTNNIERILEEANEHGTIEIRSLRINDIETIITEFDPPGQFKMSTVL
uniref:Uncharacterized protein n=1 Tax=Cruciviridae sp. TaxID=1955495 RepID=A0A1S6LVC0_9VIRU|nr:hypothetical protein [Cruciviridae sp.]